MWDARRSDRKVVVARDATYVEAPFTCPGCGGPVILKKGEQVQHHFAHQVETGCSYGATESELHAIAKRSIADGVRYMGYSAQVEPSWCRVRYGVQPDVLLYSTFFDTAEEAERARPACAVEIQCSSLPMEHLFRRYHAYARARLPVIWCVPKEERHKSGYVMNSWEAELHSLHLNRLWLWTGEDGFAEAVTPVTMKIHTGRGYGLTTWLEGQQRSICDLFPTLRTKKKTKRGVIPEMMIWDDKTAMKKR